MLPHLIGTRLPEPLTQEVSRSRPDTPSCRPARRPFISHRPSALETARAIGFCQNGGGARSLHEGRRLDDEVDPWADCVEPCNVEAFRQRYRLLRAVLTRVVR